MLLAFLLESYPHGCPSGSPPFYDCVVRQDHQSDCLSVFFKFTKDQFVLGVPLCSLKTSFVLGVPLGSQKTKDVPTGSQIARV